MNAYSSLARFYDSLTADVPYSAFADFYERIFMMYGCEVSTMLDLACGTGTLTHLLAERGYELIAADASPDMLSIAASKGGDAEIPPVFICQRMERLDLYGTVDAVVCSLDGINYVRPGLLAEVFHRVHLFLEPGGVFIFDINTPHKLRNIDGSVFLDETEEVFCVWRAELSQDGGSCIYGMDVFSKCGKLWKRSREEHVEYLYEPSELTKMLAAEGFTDIREFAEMRLDAPSNREQRVFIAAKKQEITEE